MRIRSPPPQSTISFIIIIERALTSNKHINMYWIIISVALILILLPSASSLGTLRSRKNNDTSYEEEAGLIVPRLSNPSHDLISFHEFVSIFYWVDKNHTMNDELLETFERYDADGRGEIKREELNSVMSQLGHDLSDDQMSAIVNDWVTSGSMSYNTENLHVNRMYTYGAPSVVKGTSESNPNDYCIPGLRIYNQDETVTKCSWYSIGCIPGITKITNVDFASQINIGAGYHHPKMDTLVVRLVDGTKIEYTMNFCHRTSQSSDIESYQWMPQSDLESSMYENNHRVAIHYEPRLIQVPTAVRGPSLEYASVAYCSYSEDIPNCIDNYNQETQSQLEGVKPDGWEPFAQMKQESSGIINDIDQVYVLKNDRNGIDSRKCIIAFQGSDSVLDFTAFINSSNDETTYCGIERVHSGVSNKLLKLITDDQYAIEIKPALETCFDVTCVGHSLGGSLCNLFTMCANQDSLIGAQSWDEYNLLRWKKKV